MHHDSERMFLRAPYGAAELARRSRYIVELVNAQVTAAHFNKGTQYFRLIVVG